MADSKAKYPAPVITPIPGGRPPACATAFEGLLQWKAEWPTRRQWWIHASGDGLRIILDDDGVRAGMCISAEQFATAVECDAYVTSCVDVLARRVKEKSVPPGAAGAGR